MADVFNWWTIFDASPVCETSLSYHPATGG
jgi:hypothetical protein